MPELPEVESVVTSLKSQVVGKSILDVSITEKGDRMIGGVANLEPLRKNLRGRSIEDISRVGKYIKFHFDEGNAGVVAHLRMTGRFIFRETATDHNSPDKYTRLFIRLDSGMLEFADKRRFATFEYTPDLDRHSSLLKLGPDVISPDFTVKYLAETLRNRKKPIYSSLMDQSIIAGLGNIYVCESLHIARISPLRSSDSLSLSELVALHAAIREIIGLAIAHKGTTLLDYTDSRGEQGGFKNLLKVYGRKENVVSEQAYIVHRVKISGRSVFYIPELQL